jgi:16S rRNA (adenine1518-N6/adenine1519-N6)-dimethyltransferase
VSRHALDRILSAAEPGSDDLILEVGAGVGTLTVELARAGAAVLAIEVDARFVPVLRAVCAPYPRVRVVLGDAMALLPKTLDAPPTKVVANLPYSIASPLLITLLEAGVGRRYVVMVQAEVAERIVARPGTAAYGLLAVAVQAHAAPVIVARVPRAAFFPPPQVTSAVVRLERAETPPVPRTLVPHLMAVARAAFGQRRKMLRSALRPALAGDQRADAVDALCAAAGIDPRRRGESLSLDEFARLAACRSRQGAAGPAGKSPTGAQPQGGNLGW